MNRKTWLLPVVLGLSVLAVAGDLVWAQGGPPWARRGGGAGRGPGWANRGGGPGRGLGRAGQGGADSQFTVDRDVFHFLLGNHEQIRREVRNTARGVETLTESDKPEIAVKIQEHVAAMARRVEEGRPIHMRDPLFAELFRHADKIELKYEKTDKGVRVVETSTDAEVVKLIQAHGGVVSLFVQNGFAEAMKNHEVPGAAAAGAVGCPRAGCPAAAGQCPRAVGGQCPAGPNCPRAASCPAGKDCPLAKPGPAGNACPGCPAAGVCPQGGAQQPAPAPKAPEKSQAK